MAAVRDDKRVENSLSKKKNARCKHVNIYVPEWKIEDLSVEKDTGKWEVLVARTMCDLTLPSTTKPKSRR